LPTGILIPCSEIESSSGGPITVDSIEVGAVTIPSVDMKNFKGVFSYASSKAKNVEIDMKLTIRSSFSGSVCVPIIGCWGVGGRLDIVCLTQNSSLGDIPMSGGSFCMQSPSVDFGPFSMTVPPLGGAKKTTVGKIQVTDVNMHCTEVPMTTPLGITLGDSFPVTNPMCSMDVKIKETEIEDLDSTKVSTPPASVKDIKAVNINIPSVTTKPINISTSAAINVPAISMPLYCCSSKLPPGTKVYQYCCAQCEHICTTVSLDVTSVTVRIKGGIEFKCIKGSVTTCSASSGPFDLDLNLKGLKIKGLSILGLEMPEIEVEL